MTTRRGTPRFTTDGKPLWTHTIRYRHVGLSKMVSVIRCTDLQKEFGELDARRHLARWCSGSVEVVSIAPATPATW
jgi:hypothetical protein